MNKIGITGIIASGKTVVSKFFQIIGIPVYNTDHNAKLLMNNNPEIKEKIIKHFGKHSYSNNSINTKHIANQIFNDNSKRLLINSIVHPKVKDDFLFWSKNQIGKYCAIESALIYEANFNDILDFIIMVQSPIDITINRIIYRDNISKEEAQKRINSQSFNLSQNNKPDFIINNDEKESVILQSLEILKKIAKNG